MRAYGAVRFEGGSDTRTVNVGDVGPDATVTVEFAAYIDVGLDPDAAEIVAVLSDGVHGAYDWLWIHHRVDTAGPTLTIDAPQGFARAGTNIVAGSAEDLAGIASVSLEARLLPGGVTSSIDCPQDDAHSGAWSCAWSAGALTGVETVELRARGTDTLGNVGSWSATATLTVDRDAPAVTLDPALEAALGGGVVNPNAFPYAGEVADGLLARRVELSFRRGAALSRLPLAVMPGDSPTGYWSVQRTLAGADGITETLTVYGYDGSGNRSEGLERTYRVDTVAPTITSTQHVRVLYRDEDAGLRAAPGLDATYQPGDPVLSGTVTDGSGVLGVRVRVTTPSGAVSQQDVALVGEAWSWVPQLTEDGEYVLQVEAADAAGNVSVAGPHVLRVMTGRPVFLPIAMRSYAATPAPPEVVTDWAWLPIVLRECAGLAVAAGPQATATPTATEMPTPTATGVPTPTATETPTPTATLTPSPSATPTAARAETPTPTATPTVTVTEEPTATASPPATETPTATAGPTVTEAATATAEPPAPEETMTPTPSSGLEREPELTPSATPTTAVEAERGGAATLTPTPENETAIEPSP